MHVQSHVAGLLHQREFGRRLTCAAAVHDRAGIDDRAPVERTAQTLEDEVRRGRIEREAEVVEEAIRAGAVGFSTSRTLLHRDSSGVLVQGGRK